MKFVRLIKILSLYLIVTFIGCQSAENRFEKLYEERRDFRVEVSPNIAADEDDEEASGRLARTDIEFLEMLYEKDLEFLDRLQGINRDRLSEDSQLNYDIFEIQLQNAINSFELNDHLLPLNGWWDYHATFADVANRQNLRTAEDYENYISRLSGFPEYNSGYIDRMRKGVERGFVRPRNVFDDYLDSIEPHIKDDPEETNWFEPFTDFPSSVEEAVQDSLKDVARRVITKSVVPEYERLRNFLRDEYIPASTETLGITKVPGGEEYYQYLIEMHTTLNRTAAEIHQTGLEEVARIRSEMMEIVEETGFGDDFDGFVEYLRTDPKFYAEAPEELMKQTAYVLKKMDGKLPELFKTLPRLPYGIMEIPGYLAPRTATAYYSRGASDGTRAGFYAVNTYDLPSRPLYEVVALSLHEAVPGHHLQIALQQELEELPRFRSSASFTAYTEGWALYSERLGLEVGMYDDPYDNFGRLSYEMWRALRLVVDTGIHAKGWSRDKAIDYMAGNSALSLHNIRSEVNRYIFWPGQALAYKMGEIKIRELREMAEEELSDDFDLREFHDVILLSGPVPLSVVETNVEDWIAGFEIE